MTHEFSSQIEEQAHDHEVDHLLDVLMGFLHQAEQQGACMHCVIPELVTHLADRYREVHGDEAALGLSDMITEWLQDTPPEPDTPVLWNQESMH